MYNNIVVFDTAIFAGMAELADALDSGSSEGNFVKVQVLLPAPLLDTSFDTVSITIGVQFISYKEVIA